MKTRLSVVDDVFFVPTKGHTLLISDRFDISD